MATLKLFFSLLMVTVHLTSSMAANRHMLMGNQMIDSNWYDAHATFYGDMSGGGTMRKYIYCVLVIATFYALHCVCRDLNLETVFDYCRGSLRIWWSIQARVWTPDDSTKHSIVQQWSHLRGLFRDQVFQWPSMVLSESRLYHSDRNQLLSSQLLETGGELVQSTIKTLWSIKADVH